MSWSVFRANVLRVMERRSAANNVDVIANLFATEYQNAVLRGGDIIHRTKLAAGNFSVMENLFKISLKRGIVSTGNSFSLVSELGKGVVAYWQGANMGLFPVPVIPALGAIQNIQVNQNTVIRAGVFPVYPSIFPTDNVVSVVDQFILASVIHLFTVGGVIQTISLYPSVPSPITANGIMFWNGYFVPPLAVNSDLNSNLTQRDTSVFGSILSKVASERVGNTSNNNAGVSLSNALLFDRSELVNVINKSVPEDVIVNLNNGGVDGVNAMLDYVFAKVDDCTK